MCIVTRLDRSAGHVCCAVFSGGWAIGGAVIGGAALVLLGTRIAVGTKLGGELALWTGVLAGLAAVIVPIIQAST